MSIKPNWDVLAEGICPICQDSKMIEKEAEYICNNHQYPVRISKDKFKKIVRDIENRDEPNFSKF